jgi:hypothetical protein
VHLVGFYYKNISRCTVLLNVKCQIFKNIQRYRFKRKDFNHFYLLNILAYTSGETSTRVMKCEFCARSVIKDAISACVILMCREK